MKRVLFACVHNAGRSQMAAALFNLLVDPTKAEGISAGTAPGQRVHPEVVEVMKELGVDLSAGVPQFLSNELANTASMLITMGCGDECPVVPGAERDDWPLEDPKGKPLVRVREIREEVRARVLQLVDSRGIEHRRELELAARVEREPLDLELLALLDPVLLPAGGDHCIHGA